MDQHNTIVRWQEDLLRLGQGLFLAPYLPLWILWLAYVSSPRERKSSQEPQRIGLDFQRLASRFPVGDRVNRTVQRVCSQAIFQRFLPFSSVAMRFTISSPRFSVFCEFLFLDLEHLDNFVPHCSNLGVVFGPVIDLHVELCRRADRLHV